VVEKDPLVELEELRARLAEAEETLQAIHSGAIDALVVRGPDGLQVFTLRGAQEPYRMLVERMNEGALTVAAEGAILYANQHFAGLLELPLERIVGRSLAGLVMSADGAVIADLLRQGATRSIRRELSLLRGDGGAVPVMVAGAPLDVGGIAAVLLIVTDLTTQKRSEQAVAAERFARSILEQATDSVLVCDLDGRITQASWVAERMLERPLVGRRLGDVLPLDIVETPAACSGDRLASTAAILGAVHAGQVFHCVEARIGTAELADRHFLLSASPLNNAGHHCVGSILTLTDITDRKRAEERQKTLVMELHHRVKNILAVVQSVARQTVTRSSSLANFKQAFEGRLHSISLAHDMLTQASWNSVGFDELVARSLGPYVPGASGRVAWAGPALMLPPNFVVPLAMVLHELATNAAKYGAFSVDTGQLDIAWRLIDDGQSVAVNWTERGGPPPAPEATPGFGSTLVSQMISYQLGGKAELELRPEGFSCSLEFPVPHSAGAAASEEAGGHPAPDEASRLVHSGR
jgi:PAS domain S-box-containing protein